MKLIELNPRWVGAGGPGIQDKSGKQLPERIGIGMSFECPCGNCEGRTYVDFENPKDGGLRYGTGPHWRRTGDSFETLTLTPSLHNQEEGGCGWHGYITNGEVVPV